MAYALHVKVPGLPKTPNAQNGGWQMRHGAVVKWKRKVISEIVLNRAGVPAEPLKLATLTLTRHSAVQPDYDNLVGSFKSTIDALREVGILANDKTLNFTGGRPEYRWALGKRGKGCIEIELEQA